MFRRFRVLYQGTQEFFISTFLRSPSQQSRSKKFDVISQGTLIRGTTTRRTAKFTNITETRPKQCPYCSTSEKSRPGNIERLESHWYCKSCTYKWTI